MKGRGFDDDREALFDDDKIRNSIAAYYACVSDVDNNVGKIMDVVEEANVSQKTVFIFTSDHGDNLFEHGLMQKHCFYEGAVAVPLIMSIPESFQHGADDPFS